MLGYADKKTSANPTYARLILLSVGCYVPTLERGNDENRYDKPWAFLMRRVDKRSASTIPPATKVAALRLSTLPPYDSAQKIQRLER
jgi:hypothetical protein